MRPPSHLRESVSWPIASVNNLATTASCACLDEGLRRGVPMRLTYLFQRKPNEEHEQSQDKSILRASVRSHRHGSAHLSSGMDTRLLAGVGLLGRVRRVRVGDSCILYEKRPEALGAADVCRAN